MIPTVERILFLGKIPLLSGFSTDELWQVAQVIEEVTFYKDETFIEENDVGDALYLVISGEILIHSGDTEIARVGEGAMIGELALLDGEPRSASVTALSDISLLKIDRGQFEDIMQANPNAAMGVIKVLVKRLRENIATTRQSDTRANERD